MDYVVEETYIVWKKPIQKLHSVCATVSSCYNNIFIRHFSLSLRFLDVTCNILTECKQWWIVFAYTFYLTCLLHKIIMLKRKRSWISNLLVILRKTNRKLNYSTNSFFFIRTANGMAEHVEAIQHKMYYSRQKEYQW